MVAYPVHHLASGEGHPPAPVPVIPLGVEGCPLRRPDVHLPIDVLGRRGKRVRPDRVAIIGEAHQNALNLAEIAVAHEFAGVLEPGVGTLHAPRLKDDVVFLDGLDDRAALAEGPGERFFAVDVLAPPRGLDAYERMPMVGRGHDDGVDVVAREQFAVVVVGGAVLVAVVLVHEPLVFGQLLVVDVAKRDNLRGPVPDGVFHEAAGLPAAADDAHDDAVAGRGRFVRAQGRGRDDVGRGRRRTHAAQKRPSRDSACGLALHGLAPVCKGLRSAGLLCAARSSFETPEGYLTGGRLSNGGRIHSARPGW